MSRILLPLLLLVCSTSSVWSQGNLLRNGGLQDDWITLLPELKNHHWNYTSEVFGRRDYNPDGWRLAGNWDCADADLPPGKRRLILRPGSKMTQAVNAFTVNDSHKLEGWPDAGGFPAATAIRTKRPEAYGRTLELRVKLAARDLPPNALELRLGCSQSSPIDDPQAAKRTQVVSTFAPAGDYANQQVTLSLRPGDWIEAAKKDPAFATDGGPLPMAWFVEVEHKAGPKGEVTIHAVELVETDSPPANLLSSGGFEQLAGDWPAGWSKPAKYRYFPPGVYYIFNTWHNSNSANRGLVRADELVTHSGRRALQMIVPSGDEVFVASDPIVLNQTEPRPIEVAAWVKTHQLAMLQIDAENERGERLDGFNFIHKNPLSIGTDDWRLVRQVFRPKTPVKSLRLKLAARGTNGYTLDDTGHQPQQNACGILWWDDVRVSEPESPDADLAARGVKPVAPSPAAGDAPPQITALDLGECLLGENILRARVACPVSVGEYRLVFELHPPVGEPVTVQSKLVSGPAMIDLAYRIVDPRPAGYTENRGTLRIESEAGKVLAACPIWLATWTVPIDLELGALYLAPEQKQLVRMNLGLSAAEMSDIGGVQLVLQRRGATQTLETFVVPASPAAIAMGRLRIPDGLRDDFRNLVLFDLDVSKLPVQPFDDPQRNWVIRAHVIHTDGKVGHSVISKPFCRLAHAPPQPPIKSVRINERGDVLVNDRPWMPWGVTYGHNPVYAGPADSGKFHDLANLKPWSLYDRHGGNLAERAVSDVNCLRFVEGAPTKVEKLGEMFQQGLYASTVFVKPPAAGQAWAEDYLAALKAAPNVVAVSPGPEEAFGHFAPMSAEQLAQVERDADHLRKATGRPVMVGHGGYWTRLEFEKVPFFDIFDPETEPLYPAPLHTDLAPLVAGKPKAIWLRPQMYESVPFERWRYHVYVELIRGARGWQIAHGPGDASTMRGLHAELEHLKPAIYSTEQPPQVTITPPLESLVRRVGGKTIVIAASTHGMSFGHWRWSEEKSEHGRVRETSDPHIFRDESDGYHAAGDPPRQPLVPHGIQYLIHPRSWPAGTKLATWVKLDAGQMPQNVTALVKADGRWTHAGTLGKWDLAAMRSDNGASFWFLRTFYRHARGFLGWGDKTPPYALAYLPEKTAALGDLPAAGEWKLWEIPLEQLGATGKLLDGVAFLHQGGRASWAKTELVAPDGTRTVVFGDHEDRPAPEQLGQTKIAVDGLKRGAKMRVLFEDREIVADEGSFTDDFRGTDLYQRYGGEGTGYGNSPVGFHVYEIADREP